MDAVIIHTWIPGQEAHGLSLNQFPELQLYFCQQQPQHRLKKCFSLQADTLVSSGVYFIHSLLFFHM